MKEVIKEVFSSPKEHILKAREMAEAIYRETNDKHSEMLQEIKKHLSKKHEIEVEEINKI